MIRYLGDYWTLVLTNTNSRRDETSLWSSSKVGVYGNLWSSAKVQFSVSLVGTQIHPVVISPVPQTYNWNRYIQHLAEFHTGSLTCSVRAIMAGKAKCKPLESHLPGKTVKQNQNHVPGRTAEISATIKDFKNAGMMAPTTSPFNSPIWPVQKTGGLT